jgi:hypothetical protein
MHSEEIADVIEQFPGGTEINWLDLALRIAEEFLIAVVCCRIDQAVHF